MNRYHKSIDGVPSPDGAWVRFDDVEGTFQALVQELIVESIKLRTGPPGPWNPIRADAYREVAGKIQRLLQ